MVLLLLPQFAENPANNLIYFLYSSLTLFTDFTFRYSSDFHVLCVVRGDLHFNEHMFASDLTIIQRTYVRFTPSTRFLYPPYSIAIHCVQLNCVFFVFLLPYSLQNEFVSVSMYASVCVYVRHISFVLDKWKFMWSFSFFCCCCFRERWYPRCECDEKGSEWVPHVVLNTRNSRKLYATPLFLLLQFLYMIS